MWDELDATILADLLIAGVAVAAAIGALRPGRLRLALILAWVAVPIFLIIAVLAVFISKFGVTDAKNSLIFSILLLMATLPPWAITTLLAYNLVRRFREIRTGKSKGRNFDTETQALGADPTRTTAGSPSAPASALWRRSTASE